MCQSSLLNRVFKKADTFVRKKIGAFLHFCCIVLFTALLCCMLEHVCIWCVYLVSELQHITYTKYLPLIIGATLAKKVNSIRNTNGNVFFGPVTESDDSSIYTEFNTAAFRFGHSQIKSMIKYIAIFFFHFCIYYSKLIFCNHHSVCTRLMGD